MALSFIVSGRDEITLTHAHSLIVGPSQNHGQYWPGLGSQPAALEDRRAKGSRCPWLWGTHSLIHQANQLQTFPYRELCNSHVKALRGIALETCVNNFFWQEKDCQHLLFVFWYLLEPPWEGSLSFLDLIHSSEFILGSGSALMGV